MLSAPKSPLKNMQNIQSDCQNMSSVSGLWDPFPMNILTADSQGSWGSLRLLSNYSNRCEMQTACWWFRNSLLTSWGEGREKTSQVVSRIFSIKGRYIIFDVLWKKKTVQITLIKHTKLPFNINKQMIPSRKLTYPTWKKENHLQNGLFKGYVSSQEGTTNTFPKLDVW